MTKMKVVLIHQPVSLYQAIVVTSDDKNEGWFNISACINQLYVTSGDKSKGWVNISACINQLYVTSDDQNEGWVDTLAPVSLY